MAQLRDDPLHIALGSVTEAPPARLPRPSQDAESATRVGAPEREAVPCFVRVTAVEAMFEHALQHPELETGGLLVGRICQDDAGAYLRVEGAVPARLAHRTATSLTFTFGAWTQLHADRAQRFPGMQVVGWFHTHPRLSVFLSGPDRFLHHSVFSRRSDVALVLDLFSREWGVFSWHDNCLRLAAGFFVYAQEPEEGRGLRQLLESCRTATGRDTCS